LGYKREEEEDRGEGEKGDSRQGSASKDVRRKNVIDRRRARSIKRSRNLTKHKARHAGAHAWGLSDSRVLGPVCAWAAVVRTSQSAGPTHGQTREQQTARWGKARPDHTGKATQGRKWRRGHGE